jgi:hypothetical protein
MSMFQSASGVHIQHSILNNTRDQTNVNIIHDSNNRTSQTEPTPIMTVRAHASFFSFLIRYLERTYSP